MRVDVHQHLIPTVYRQAMEDHDRTAGGWPTPAWSAPDAIAMMDRRSIATGILSISAPGVHFGDDAQARALARTVNDEHAELVKDRPDRFGQFAVLPLPDVDGAVAEAVRCLDELGADGVVLLSNADGRYLGDPLFEPLWAELDARSALVFVHPTAPPIPMLDGLPSPILDFPFDTTRTALHMATHGVLRRHRRVRVILSHAGGFLPFAAQRFIGAAMFNPDTTPETIMDDLRSFYFDTALSASPYALPSLLAFARPGHVLYGSDWPFAPVGWGVQFDDELVGYPGWAPGQLAEVEHGAAQVLLPRLVR